MRKIIIATLAVFLLYACSKDDSPPDPRVALTGEYQSHEDHLTYASREDATSITDSTYTVPAGIHLTIRLEESSDSLILDLEEMVDNVFSVLLVAIGAPAHVEFANRTPAFLNEDNTFQLKNPHMTITYAGIIHPAIGRASCRERVRKIV